MVLGKEVLSNGIGDPMFTFLKWPLPSGDAAVRRRKRCGNGKGSDSAHAACQFLVKTPPAPRCPIASPPFMTALPFVLPRVTDNNGTYLDGAVILKDGVRAAAGCGANIALGNAFTLTAQARSRRAESAHSLRACVASAGKTDA